MRWSLIVGVALLATSCASAEESKSFGSESGSVTAELGWSSPLDIGLQEHRVVVEGSEIGRQRVAYFDTGGSGPTLVFIHSNSCSKSCWQRQLSDTLPDGSVNPLSGFRRIAFDLPGHGRTRRLDGDDNQYSVAFYADAIAAFSDALGLSQAVYVGHSLGGHALIEAGQLLPNPAGALIFGTPPFSTHEQLNAAFFPMPGGPHFLTEELRSRDIHHWEASVFHSDIPDWFKASVRRTDPMARSGLAASLVVLADEIQMVVDYPCPFAIVQGEFERSVRLSYLESLNIEDELWRGEIQMVEESNHFTSYDQPALFNDIVADLVADVTSP